MTRQNITTLSRQSKRK